VSFSFQDNFKDAISKDGIGAVTDDGFTAIQVNKISKEAKGWLAFELLTGVSQKDGSFSKGAAASILAISIAAVGLATATGGLAFIPFGFAVLGFGAKWSKKFRQARREDTLEALFSTGFESDATFSNAQQNRFQVPGKWKSIFEQVVKKARKNDKTKSDARFAEYADALGEEAEQGHRSSMHGRRGRRAASARRNAKRLIRLSDLHYTD